MWKKSARLLEKVGAHEAHMVTIWARVSLPMSSPQAAHEAHMVVLVGNQKKTEQSLGVI